MSTAQAQVPAVDMNKLNAFLGQFVSDLGAAVHAGMVVIGEKLGLYKALAEGPVTPLQLALRTQTDERYLREWLASQAAGGYITYDDKNGKFSLNEEQAFALATEDSPAYLPGAFELALGSLAAVPRIAESFRTGAGMGWHEHEDGVFHGCEKFFRPGYAANLVSTWIPCSARRQRKARSRGACGRCRLREGSVHHIDGEGIPQLAFLRIRLSRQVDRSGARIRPPEWRRRPRDLRSGSRQRASLGGITTSSRSSTACTIWVTQSEPPHTFDSLWPRMVPG